MYTSEFDDEIDTSNNTNTFLSNINIPIKKIVIIGSVILIIILIVVAIGKNDKSETIYEKMERELIVKAKTYVKNNSVSSNNEVYLTSNKLDYKLDDSCSSISGVLYYGEEYQPYLYCKEYQTKIFEDEDANFKLNGEKILFIKPGVEYLDLGYLGSKSIQISGEVQKTEGVYTLYYIDSTTLKKLTRKVVVLNDTSLSYPIIKLTGDNVIYQKINSMFKDPGVAVTDAKDGIISKVIKNSNVNTKKVGEYEITYAVTNSQNLTSMQKRTVYVIDTSKDKINVILSPKTPTNKKVTITLNINSDNFVNVTLPDKKISKKKEVKYTVEKNGTYTFTINYKDGSKKTEKVKVENIDKTQPKGTCTATKYDENTKVTVKQGDKKKIASYTYTIGKKKEAVISSTSYVSKTIKPTKVSVTILDVAGNKKTISCKMVDKTSKDKPKNTDDDDDEEEKSTDPVIVSDSKGKLCLEGFACYVQFHYSNSSYPFCSMNGNPNSCGGIGRNGCSITAASIIIAGFGLRDSNGNLYNPYSVWEHLYPINKSTGKCSGSCSGWTSIQRSFTNAGLSATSKMGFNGALVKEALRSGKLVIIHAKAGPYAVGNGHYMAIIGINSKDEVFVSNPSNRCGIYQKSTGIADTWVSTDVLAAGKVDEMMIVSKPG